MTCTVSSRGKEGVSTPSTQQALYICLPGPLKERLWEEGVNIEHTNGTP